MVKVKVTSPVTGLPSESSRRPCCVIPGGTTAEVELLTEAIAAKMPAPANAFFNQLFLVIDSIPQDFQGCVAPTTPRFKRLDSECIDRLPPGSSPNVAIMVKILLRESSPPATMAMPLR